MFHTPLEFEQWMPPGLGMEDSRYWDVAMLACEWPWFFLTMRVAAGEGAIHQTMLVSWEKTLASLLSKQADDVISLHHVCPDAQRGGKWVMHELVEVWQPTDDEREDTGPLLFRRRGNAELHDSHQNARAVNSRRRLLLALP